MGGGGGGVRENNYWFKGGPTRTKPRLSQIFGKKLSNMFLQHLNRNIINICIELSSTTRIIIFTRRVHSSSLLLCRSSLFIHMASKFSVPYTPNPFGFSDNSANKGQYHRMDVSFSFWSGFSISQRYQNNYPPRTSTRPHTPDSYPHAFQPLDIRPPYNFCFISNLEINADIE